MSRADVSFTSDGLRCAAWHYPGGDACVVMGHGFGATREGGLHPYAERFQAAGYSVLVFDYRHFGDSEGEPRQLLDIKRQHADWKAAVAYARTLEGAERIVLWGSSFSGGHVIATAAGDPALAAVISQVPHTSGPASIGASGRRVALRLTVAGLRDQLRVLRGAEPFYMKTVGPPGTLGAMTTPDAEPGYSALYQPGVEWRNEVTARVALRIGAYSPGRQAAKVRCPLLVQVAEQDAVTPPAPAIKAARAAPRGELLTYPLGHFDLYRGEPFERAVSDQLDFLGRHVAL